MNQQDIDYAFACRERKRVYSVSDCERIQEYCKSKGILISLLQCYTIWSDYSDGMAASWLSIRDDDEIESAINSFLRSNIEAPC